MTKLVIVILTSILVTIFVIQNSDHVIIQLFIGPPIKIRLAFLLLISGVFGYLWSTISALRKQRRLIKQIKDLKGGH